VRSLHPPRQAEPAPLAVRRRIGRGAEWEPRYNIPPTASFPVARLADGKRQPALFKWGAIASRAKNAKIPYSIITAARDAAWDVCFHSALKRIAAHVQQEPVTFDTPSGHWRVHCTVGVELPEDRE
jgi:hypothetical protein